MKVDTRVIIAGLAIVVVLAIIAVIGVACCACIFCASTSQWGNWGTSIQTEQRTDTTVHAGAPNIELYVDTFNGNIEIQESATTQDVTVTYEVRYPQGRMSDVLTGTRSDIIGNDTVRITAEARRNAGFLTTGNYGADITVLVPKNSSYTITLNTRNGDIRLAPLHGSRVTLRTDNGNLNLVGGSYDDVYMETFNGNAEATEAFETTNATLITKNGNVVADTLQRAGTLHAETWNGNVRVTLPRDTLFTIDASSTSGRVRHGSIPMSPTTDRSTLLVGPTQGGAGNLTVTLKTLNGNVDIDY